VIASILEEDRAILFLRAGKVTEGSGMGIMAKGSFSRFGTVKALSQSAKKSL